jgi:hypothetical protein
MAQCRHRRAADHSCMVMFNTQREAAAIERHAGGCGWEAIMFTIDELARIPLFSALTDKEREYLA